MHLATARPGCKPSSSTSEPSASLSRAWCLSFSPHTQSTGNSTALVSCEDSTGRGLTPSSLKEERRNAVSSPRWRDRPTTYSVDTGLRMRETEKEKTDPCPQAPYSLTCNDLNYNPYLSRTCLTMTPRQKWISIVIGGSHISLTICDVLIVFTLSFSFSFLYVSTH